MHIPENIGTQLYELQQSYNQEPENRHRRVTIVTLKEVFERGVKAYQELNEPVSRNLSPEKKYNAGLARVKAFLYKAEKGSSYNGLYSHDNDLLDFNGISHEQFADGGEILLAPNGKPSNLTPEQYRLVRTPEFKAWFGDFENSPETASKVVDENGEPLVVYHGTKHNFTIFRDTDVERNTMGNSVGMYFTNNKVAASRMDWEGKYIEVFLNIKNLIKLKKFSNDDDWFKILGEELNKAKGLPDRAETYWFLKNGRGYRGLDTDNVGQVVKELSQKKGIDGYYFPENMFSDLPPLEVYVVFEPTQIKLADGTNTTFDSENPDIRFKSGGEMRLSKTPAPKKERIYGSETNPKGSSSSGKAAKEITFSESTLKSIRNKIDEHNAKHPKKKVTLEVAKAVVRRGMGAYSSTHRPTLKGGRPNSRTAWGLARLNAFLYKAVNGKSKSGRYSEDNDLLDELGITHQKFAEGGEILLAPNGKPSNLTPEQWHLVRTPEFKAWFGDWENDPENASKVVDENGDRKSVV
jgi:hypothetical protein